MYVGEVNKSVTVMLQLAPCVPNIIEIGQLLKLVINKMRRLGLHVKQN